MLRAQHRDVAPVVARRFLLLVGILVLFIDDDEAEVRAPARRSAERAPMTMRARPSRILCHSSCRSPSLRWRVQHGDFVLRGGEAAT